jgi:hypothetical protein
MGDRVSRNWLLKTGYPYLEEIDHYADHLNLTGIHALNICFEWGCTSAVYAKKHGPTMTRVLDWTFPELGENLIVAHQSGIAGDFGRAVSGMYGHFVDDMDLCWCHQLRRALAFRESLEFRAFGAGLLRDQHQLLALARIWDCRDGRRRAGPNFRRESFDSGKRDHLAADLGEPLRSPLDSYKTSPR